MKHLKREFPMLILTLLPIAVLYYFWSAFPPSIPLHYGIDGQPDRFGDKQTLQWFIPVTTLLLYAVLWAVPYIDPKKRINPNQRSYLIVRLILTGFLCLTLTGYLLSLMETWNFDMAVAVTLMVFLMVLGNYLPTLRQNYFVGIRTPWTLHNDQVWTRTHRFSGRLWMIVGVAGMCWILLVPGSPILTIALVAVAGVGITSILYSYVVYRQQPATKE